MVTCIKGYRKYEIGMKYFIYIKEHNQLALKSFGNCTILSFHFFQYSVSGALCLDFEYSLFHKETQHVIPRKVVCINTTKILNNLIIHIPSSGYGHPPPPKGNPKKKLKNKEDKCKQKHQKEKKGQFSLLPLSFTLQL